MARVGQLAAKDIDALWVALRPRILGVGSGAGTLAGTPGPQGPAGPKGVVWRGEWAVDTDYEEGDIVWLATTGGSILTYFSLADHTSVLATKPIPGGVASYWHEISPGYLIIDGSRAMTGDLNMDDHEVDAVKNLNMAGATLGEAQANDVRQLHLIGDDDDGEARIDGAERVVFNNEPTKSVIENPSRLDMNVTVEAGVDYAAAEGITSWDNLEDTLIVNVASGAGLVAVALGWAVKLAVAVVPA